MIHRARAARGRTRGFSYLELVIATSLILLLWITAFESTGPGLESSRRARTMIHREAAQSASLLSFHARHGQVARDVSELKAHLVGGGSTPGLSFRTGRRTTAVRPDGRGGVVIQEEPW